MGWFAGVRQATGHVLVGHRGAQRYTEVHRGTQVAERLENRAGMTRSWMARYILARVAKTGVATSRMDKPRWPGTAR